MVESKNKETNSDVLKNEKSTLEEKIKIIDAICERHPVSGTEKGWSWYHGGMADTGAWYFRKMLDVPIEELREFLDYLIAEENKPVIVIPLTAEEERDSKIFRLVGRNCVTTELERKRLHAAMNDRERRLLFGE